MTGDNLADNLRSIRRARNMSLRDVETALARIGHPIALSGLSKIENRDRRVDVDDLTALAIALDVSPLALLIPPTRSHRDVVEVTGAKTSAARLWWWGTGERPLDDRANDVGDPVSPEAQWRRHEFGRLAHPWWAHPDLHVFHEGLADDVLDGLLEQFDAGELGQGALRPPREEGEA